MDVQANRAAEAVGGLLFAAPDYWWLQRERMEEAIARSYHLEEPAILTVRREGLAVASIGMNRSGPHQIRLAAPLIRRCAVSTLGGVDGATACVTVSGARLLADYGGLALLLMLTAFGLYHLLVLRPLQLLDATIDSLENETERARAADVAKSEFLATMSHEIRTPLNGVLGMTELLAGTALDKRQRLFAETIQTSGVALLGVINDILDFSKIDAGRLRLVEEPFRLADLADNPGRLLSLAAHNKGLEITSRVALDLPRMVTGDFTRLRQVVINLLNNAIKFTDRGEVGVEIIKTASQTAMSSAVDLKVSIHDTGCGIPPDKLSMIFDRFTQVDQSSTRKGQGTGLGLAIAKGLIELMGGEIGVESVEGVGTTFWFTLTLPASESPSQYDPEHVVAVSGRNVLVVDDNETNRMILDEILSSWRIDSTEVASGRDALRKLRAAVERNCSFDLVILDHHMPAMSGLEVLAEMRASPELAKTPVILLSSLDALDEIDEPALRPSAVLTKPAPRSDLFDAILTVLMDAAAAQQEPISALGHGETGSQSVQRNPERAGTKGEDLHPPVLVVDDNDVNRTVAGFMLESAGMSCAFAEDGREALEYVRTHRPKIVLMDVSMPIMDGLEATIAIRDLEREEGCKDTTFIIGVTAHAFAADRERCIAAGMDAHLPKPIDRDALIALLEPRRGGLIAETGSPDETQELISTQD